MREQIRPDNEILRFGAIRDRLEDAGSPQDVQDSEGCGELHFEPLPPKSKVFQEFEDKYITPQVQAEMRRIYGIQPERECEDV